jgi:hypothetical protein
MEIVVTRLRILCLRGPESGLALSQSEEKPHRTVAGGSLDRTDAMEGPRAKDPVRKELPTRRNRENQRDTLG